MAPVRPSEDDCRLLLESLESAEAEIRMAHIIIQMELRDAQRADVWVGDGSWRRESVKRLAVAERITRAAQGTLGG